MHLSREQLYEEENRMNSGNDGTGWWDPFGWINKWGHAPGLEPSWVNDAIYAHYVADNINEMYASPYGGYWNPSMSSAYAFSSSNEALGFAVSNNPDITVTAYGGGALGSQDILYENASTGSAVVVKTPFWRITGSYYNELYYFSGLVAYDVYSAKESLISTNYLADAPAQDFSGLWGGLKYAWTGGNIDGYHYSLNGLATGLAPITGIAPSPGKAGLGLKNASTGLKLLFKNGIKGNSIINIRSTLLKNGFTQSLTQNKSGYLFRNNLGEQVRIMYRNGVWDARIMNQYGNYLDSFGNIGTPGSTHNIYLWPW